MSEVLAKGIWCPACAYLETEEDLGQQTCLACGCDNELHHKVKVVKDKDDDELIEWELDLTVRAHNVLRRYGIHTMGQLREVINTDPNDFNGTILHDMKGLGLKSIDQIKDQFRRWEEAHG
jgi:DNA-directed RNA polymerase alpha subunit